MAFWSKKRKIEHNAVPRHIAIIMDGNGRWAKKRGLPRRYGHRVGAKVFRRIATYCKEIGVQYITVYAFSTENWKRPQDEVEAIMELLSEYIDTALAEFEENRIRLCFLGDRTPLSDKLKAKMAEVEEKSKKYTTVCNIALNYGGRAEILHAARALLEAGEEPTEENFSRHLYTAGQPDPDLIIRPSGELRLSNFLLWQCAYSEFYFTDVLWPDFTPAELDRAVADYNGRKRRYGGV